MEEEHKFSIINRKHRLWTIYPQIDLHSLSLPCCFCGSLRSSLVGFSSVWFGFSSIHFQGIWLSFEKIWQLFLKDKIGYKSQKSVSSSYLKLSGREFAKQFKELSDTGKANLKNSSKDWGVILLLQLKLSKKQISKSPSTKKDHLFRNFYADCFLEWSEKMVNIHPTKQKFHFAFVYPEKKYPEQETQVESGNAAYYPGLDRKNIQVIRNINYY